MDNSTFAVFAAGVAVATSVGSLTVSILNATRDRSHLTLTTAFHYQVPVYAESVHRDHRDQRWPVCGDRHKPCRSSGRQDACSDAGGELSPEGLCRGRRAERRAHGLIPEDSFRQQVIDERLQPVSRVFANTSSGRRYENDASAPVRKALNHR